MQTKGQLRSKMRLFLKDLSTDEVRERSKSLSKLLHGVMEPKRHLLWGVFAPLEGEPLWDMELEKSGMQFSYPAPTSSLGKMEFFLCRREQLSKRRGFGAPVPCPPLGQPKALPQAFLVPALAYSRVGARVGRGGGYYDQILKAHDGMRVGVCFDEQLCREVPIEEHDQKVQVVVTDKQIVFCESGQ